MFCKFNLKAEYPPPYQHCVWDFKKSNNNATKQATELVNWNFLFSNHIKMYIDKLLFSTKH